MSDRFFIWSAFIVFAGYYVILVLFHFFLAALAFFEDRTKAKEDASEEYAALSASSFTLPVSVIIPAHNEEAWILDAVQAVMRLDYPQFELIVVDDGSTDRTLEILKGFLQLEPSTQGLQDRFDSGPVREVWVSRKDPRVTVVSKEAGHKKAGAMNAALNIAHYRYICVMDADEVLEPDALLKVMSHVQKDPEHIVGIGSYFALANDLRIRDGKVLNKGFSQKPIIAYQNLEYIRAFIGNRIAWSRLNSMPIVSGGFGVWRRDVVKELGGFDRRWSSEDLEFTFRVHDFIVKERKQGYRILMLPYPVGWTEGPDTVRSLIQQRNRWQRTTDETVLLYRHMFLNPKYGFFGFLVFPYFLFYEALGVFFELGSLAITLWGWFSGLLDGRVFVAVFSFMVLVQVILSLLSIFIFTRYQRLLSLKEVVYLVLLSFFEFFWYRGLISVAKVWGTLDFLRGVRTQDKVPRTGSVF